MSLDLNETQNKADLKVYIDENFFKTNFIADVTNALENCEEKDVRIQFLDILNDELAIQDQFGQVICQDALKNRDNATWTQAISNSDYIELVWSQVVCSQKDYLEYLDNIEKEYEKKRGNASNTKSNSEPSIDFDDDIPF